MIYTNVESFGGDFMAVVDREFEESRDVSIASGYVSLDIINRYKAHFERIAKNGGQARLILGMAFYEGLTKTKLEALKQLAEHLEKINEQSGVYVTYSERYHGKVYLFKNEADQRVYLGSSNFSRSGLAGNIECTALLDDKSKQQAKDFLEYLFSPDNAVPISKADIVTLGTADYKRRLKLTSLDQLARYDTATIVPEKYEHFEYPLDRVVDKEKSNLNVYFGKGRWSRSSGKVTPRPWYEVELIAPREINSQPLYPQGNFTAYTDDGYVIPMKTSGDYHKNIRSRGGLQIFGQWMKGKLQRSGALVPLTPVTQDTLDAYGSSSIRFHKLKDGEYYLAF